MSEEKLNVLFVDDEAKILDGLRRQLRGHRGSWEMRFAISGEAALTMLAEQPADVIVSDMRMPGMTGGQLLTLVRDLYPQATRIILSGQTDQADLLCELGCIHQYLQKPCDGERLCASIDRTRGLSRLLSQPILRAVANRVTALPPASETYRQLVDELGKKEASLQKVASIVAADPALSAKVMQLVNSSFFGMPRKVNSASAAAVLMGLNTIHAIVVAGRIFDLLSKSAQQKAAISVLWQACVQIGELAAKVAKADGASESMINQSRLAGLLCCIGRVILLTSTPEIFKTVMDRVAGHSTTYLESELEMYGATQDEVTAYALGLWAFPEEIIESVALQSQPTLLPPGKRNDVLTYLHLARSMHEPTAMGLDESITIDRDFLIRVGAESLMPEQARKAA